jgi:hypothetical protein
MAKFTNGAEIDNQATNICDEVERFVTRWEYWCNQMAAIPSADMLAAGLTQGQIDQIVACKTDLATVIADFRANHEVFIRRQSRLCAM